MWTAIGIVATLAVIALVINSQGLKWLTYRDNPRERDDA